MRIVYGIHGYGQGHATRALSVLPALRRHHDLLLLAGGDAYHVLSQQFPVVRVPSIGYAYRAGGHVSLPLTLVRNSPAMLDRLFHGAVFDMVLDAVRDFDVEVFISDAEPWAHGVAKHLGLPRIGFDHFGIMAFCRPEMSLLDRARSFRDVWTYRTLMGQPDRVIVSSFYDAPAARTGVRLVGTLLRDDVFHVTPQEGDHILVYLNQGDHLLTPRIEDALRGAAARMLIFGTSRIGAIDNLEFRPRGNQSFLEALASARAVISTAGNQLVGEAIHFRKPLLVMPEDCVEQRINARAVEQMGIGVRADRRRLSPRIISDFLGRCGEFASNMKKFDRDGRSEAVAALNRGLEELTGRSVPSAAEATSRVA